MAEQDTTQTIEGEDAAGQTAVGNLAAPDDGFLQHGNGNVEVSIDTLLVVQGLGTFLTVFVKKVADELGDGAIARVKAWRHRGGVLVRTELPELGEVFFAIGPDTPDEARLALLDTDVTAPELRGATLHWNAERNQWQPGESAEPEQQ